jgi:PHD/YefM family antitoxin component YafN of YafNO toxin-antitoxin module
MKNWKLADADEELTRIVRQAVHHAPQRVTLNEDLQVVVLSAAEYARLTGEPLTEKRADLSANGEQKTGRTLVELIQNSPWAEAVRDGDWPWDWDDETRSWVERAA